MKTFEEIALQDSNKRVKSKGCGRDDCCPCSNKSTKCKKNGVGYSICCETCKLAGRTTIYSGDTRKNGFTRGKQHLDALRLKDEENALWKNCMVDHGGKKAKFSMKDK